MSDLIERLRSAAKLPLYPESAKKLLDEAADEIEKLTTGKWLLVHNYDEDIGEEYIMFMCSHCYHEFPRQYPVCIWCGSKMINYKGEEV